MNSLEQRLDTIFRYHNWRQRIPLGNGYETPGTNFSSEWEKIFMPKDLSGLSFLDVGSNDGLFSFLAEKKGASIVHSTDIYKTDENASHMTDGWNKRGIELAKKFLSSKINLHEKSIYELDQIPGSFDVVFCANVLAWLKDPRAAVEQLAAKSKGQLILREDISVLPNHRPLLEYVHKAEAPNATCFYNPNRKWFEVLLKELGFSQISFQLIDEKEIVEERMTSFTLCKLSEGTAIYESPFDANPGPRVIASNTKGRRTFTWNDFAYFPNHGWLKSNVFQVMETGGIKQGNKIKSAVKKALGKGQDWQQVNHTIIASR